MCSANGRRFSVVFLQTKREWCVFAFWNVQVVDFETVQHHRLGSMLIANDVHALARVYGIMWSKIYIGHSCVQVQNVAKQECT